MLRCGWRAQSPLNTRCMRCVHLPCALHQLQMAHLMICHEAICVVHPAGWPAAQPRVPACFANCPPRWHPGHPPLRSSSTATAPTSWAAHKSAGFRYKPKGDRVSPYLVTHRQCCAAHLPFRLWPLTSIPRLSSLLAQGQSHWFKHASVIKLLRVPQQVRFKPTDR